MVRFLLYLAKIGIILYLATQAFVDYDLLVILFNSVSGIQAEVPYGFNITNVLLFFLGAFLITRKELSRSNKIAYFYSPESTELLETQDTVENAGNRIDHLLDKNMGEIFTRQFPPTIPLQLSDIITTSGFEIHQEDEAEGVLEYVEELSPLEVLTSKLFNWIRSEAQFKRFRLELHKEEDYQAIGVNSGNSETDVYLCLEHKQDAENEIAASTSSISERLAAEAALRMFFEAESQICRDFTAFERFYQLVRRFGELHDAAGSRTFDQLHQDVLKEIDEILELEPSFLTMQVLRGIIACQHSSKSIQVYDEALGIFDRAIEDAKRYYRNRKREKRRAWIPSFLRRNQEDEHLISISKETMLYTQGLSEVFKARIFSQNAHRFGKYDNAFKQFLKERRKVEKELDHGIRFLGTARNRIPFFGRLRGQSMTRIPLAYQVRGFLHHCHDFFDKDEVFFRNPSKTDRTSDAVNDLEEAIKVYSKGIELCGKQKIGGTPKYALHTGTRLHNNCGFTRLYHCLIEGKLNNRPLNDLAYFPQAKFDSYYSAIESDTFYSYPFANLGLAYTMHGGWEQAAMAGVASMSRRVYQKARELNQDRDDPSRSRAWIYSPERLESYEALLSDAFRQSEAHMPTKVQPYKKTWSYVEGLSELSYGYLFKSLCVPEDQDALAIGLALHERALRLFVKDEMQSKGEVNDVSNNRIKNIMTNLVRSFWHFDDRTNDLEEATVDTIHTHLHQKITVASESWASIPPGTDEWEMEMNRSIDQWIQSLSGALDTKN